MDSRRPRPSTGPSNGGGNYLQGVWMSKCESGRIERLTKWSDGQRDHKLGTLDQQEHNSMVRMNLQKLEIRDELAALKRSRRTPVSGHTPGMQEMSSPNPERKHGKPTEKVSGTKKAGSREETAPSRDSGKSASRSPGAKIPRSKVLKSSGRGKVQKGAPSTPISVKHPQSTKTEHKENPSSEKTVQKDIPTELGDIPRLTRKLGRVELDEESLRILNGRRDHEG